MNKWRVVAAHEYRQQVRRKGFLIATFGLPLLMVGLFVVAIWLAVAAEQVDAVGYVDNAGLLRNEPARVVLADAGGSTGLFSDPPVTMLRYPDLVAGRGALDSKAIAVLFVVPADYTASGRVTAYAPNHVPDLAQTRFTTLLRRDLLAGLPADPRLAAPIVEVQRRTLDDQPSNPFSRILVPLIYGILFFVATFSSSSYLMQSLVDEKENRVMEVLGTSLPPGGLMLGKILGLGAVGLTQLAVWVTGGLLALAVAGGVLPDLAGVSLPWPTVALMLALFLPSYLLFAASLATVGAMVTVRQEGQQLAGIFSLLGVLPTWFVAVILTDPNGPVATGLSLFPYTAPLTLLLRQQTTDLPVWQIPLSLLILTSAAAGMIWLAGRMLRYGMLRYGKRVGWRELGRALRGA
ncbi:MAG: ABC transporter permease [Chloroflexota bacterium]|nr:ABC transporter permease [Chloroflexota bacterium]